MNSIFKCLPILTLITLLAISACSDDPGSTTKLNESNIDVDKIEFNKDELVFWTGEIDTISATAYDIEGNALDAEVNWKVANNYDVIQITQEGIIKPTAPGTATVIAYLNNKEEQFTFTVNRKFRGQLNSFNDINFDQLYLVAFKDGNNDTTKVSTNGLFSFKPKRVQIEGNQGFSAYLINQEGVELNYHPFWIWDHEYLNFDPNKYKTNIMLVPKKWLIEAGDFQSEIVDISMNTAFTTPEYLPAFYGSSYTNDTRFFSRSSAVDTDLLPYKVGFWRGGSDAQITADDSLHFWNNIIDHMESRFGRNLFKPIKDPGWESATYDLDRSTFGSMEIRITIDRQLLDSLGYAGLGGERCGSPDWRVTLFAPDWVDSFEPSVKMDECKIEGGSVRVHVIKADDPKYIDGHDYVTMHELMHAIGLGHGCNFPSIQGRCPKDGLISKEDVAYWEVKNLLQTEAHKLNADGSLFRALLGERNKMGLSVLPNMQDVKSKREDIDHIFFESDFGHKLIVD